MPPISEQFWVDGRPAFRTLTIQEDADSVTIAIGPRRAGFLAMIAAAGLVLLAALELVLLAALLLFDWPPWSAALRIGLAVAASVALLGISVAFVWQLRRQVNYRVVTIEEGIVAIASAPVWPWRATIQLNVRDVINVLHHPRRRLWPLRAGATVPLVEYGVTIFHSGKGERQTEIIPPFTLSPPEAGKLNALIDKYAFPRSERSLVNCRL